MPGHVGVFVLPPSFEVLEQRLRGRSKDTEEAMQRRLATARDEVAAFAEYDYVVVNDELDACVERLRAIVLAERARLRSMRGDRRSRSSRRFIEMIDHGDRRDRLPNAFEFVIIAGARARQLLRGCTPRTTRQRQDGHDSRRRKSREGKVEKIQRGRDRATMTSHVPADRARRHRRHRRLQGGRGRARAAEARPRRRRRS